MHPKHWRNLKALWPRIIFKMLARKMVLVGHALASSSLLCSDTDQSWALLSLQPNTGYLVEIHSFFMGGSVCP